MKNYQKEIVILYDEQGLSKEEIAGTLELDVDYIEGVLMQFSKKFRGAEAPQNEDTLVKRGEVDEYLRRYKNLALSTENEYIAERTLRFLLNEAMGRNKVAALEGLNKQGRITINIELLNEAILAAKKEKLLIEDKKT